MRADRLSASSFVVAAPLAFTANTWMVTGVADVESRTIVSPTEAAVRFPMVAREYAS
jgi:hypothetical protein